MSIKCSMQVWQDNTVRNTAKLMLLAIADFANDEGICWPPVSRLAQMVGVTQRQAQRLIAELEAAGKVRVQRGSGRGIPSVYMLLYGVKTVTSETETVTSGGERVTYVSPITPAKTVTSAAKRVTSASPNGDICGQKGDMVPHACGEPSTKPSEQQPSEQQPSSSSGAAALIGETLSATGEDEDEVDRFYDDDPLLAGLAVQLEEIAGRQLIDAEWRALDDALVRFGAGAVERSLFNLRNVWDRIHSRDNLANWVRSASERANVSAHLPGYRKDTASSRRAAYLPSHHVESTLEQRQAAYQPAW